MAKEVQTVGKILFDDKQISKRAKEIGAQLSKDFAGEEVILIGTLKGSLPWMAQLLKNVTGDVKIDFLAASSYGSSTMSSGVVKINLEPSQNLYNKNIIIVEDIIDTGNTLAYVKKKLSERNPKSVSICTMLDKPARRKVEVEADYVGFTVDDLFVIGYGLDYDEKYRNLPYVSYLDSDDVDNL